MPACSFLLSIIIISLRLYFIGMLCRKKGEGLTEKKAIHILLDCSNTLRMNKGEEGKEGK